MPTDRDADRQLALCRTVVVVNSEEQQQQQQFRLKVIAQLITDIQYICESVINSNQVLWIENSY